MLQSLKVLQGYTIHGTDGEIGKVREFYFDSNAWKVRYLVVDSGDWLDGRVVLLAPVALGRPDFDAEALSVPLSREQVRSSPSIDTNRPVSREQETALLSYYQWPLYWQGDAIGPSLPAYPLVDLVTQMQQAQTTLEPENGLRSSREVMGYKIHARDGEIGRVEDFIFEDESWRILYMVVDVGGWLVGRKVLVSPSWVQQVRWADSEVQVDLAKETIQNSPEYDPAAPLTRDFETRLYDHYQQRRYWENDGR
jgi:hypothetical protein